MKTPDEALTLGGNEGMVAEAPSNSSVVSDSLIDSEVGSPGNGLNGANTIASEVTSCANAATAIFIPRILPNINKGVDSSLHLWIRDVISSTDARMVKFASDLFGIEYGQYQAVLLQASFDERAAMVRHNFLGANADQAATKRH